MCGINGIINFSGKEVLKEDLFAMNEKINHRGPDHQGIWIDKNIGLGHVRLSIIDLNPRSNQPFIYQHQGKKIILTYNGEIYNFKEIRQELIRERYFFNTECDTEVLAASYIKYGVNCLSKFNGMFAFAIYDPQKNIIFAARDRFGQKPFKYFIDNNRFIFSSELKAILENKVDREIDYNAIDDFLTLQYVPAPYTGFENIYKLPNAHFLTFDIKSKKIEIKKYFDLDYSKKINLSKKEWINKIEKELAEAVKKRLVADVPLGVFLSGGVDSSSIVAIMSRFKSNIKSFSISFKEKKFNESEYAKRVANLYKTEHREFEISPCDLIKNIDDIVYQFEEPFADVSILPTFILSKLTKKYVTVALSGDGGDENFGGYDKYRIHFLILKYKFLIYLLFMLKPFVKNYKFKTLLWSLNKSINERHYNFTNYFNDLMKKIFYKKDFNLKLNNKNKFNLKINDKSFNLMNQVFYLDFNSYIPDDINTKVDLASMYYALEVRSPMLDLQFVQVFTQMPVSYKLSLFSGKRIFKEMLLKFYSKEFLNRRKKGFSVPIGEWFRNDLKDRLKNELFNKESFVLNVFEREKLESLINEHSRGVNNHGKRLWMLYVLNIWHKKYFYENI